MFANLIERIRTIILRMLVEQVVARMETEDLDNEVKAIVAEMLNEQP
jgi:hypothetical protein